MRNKLPGRVCALLLLGLSLSAHAQYTTQWIANTFGHDAGHVGNAARSMWVAPEGVIYTASLWDENAGGVGIYRHRATVGSIGGHNEFQGSAITGNADDLFVALQYNRALGGSGLVGRYDRATKVRDLVIAVSDTRDAAVGDVIAGLATSGSLLYVSDLPGHRVRVYTTAGEWKRDIAVGGPGALAVDGKGNLWVAQKARGAVVEYSPAGARLRTIQLAASARPVALYVDWVQQELLVGDEGPDMNIKRYGIAGTPALKGSIGTPGGYLDASTGIKGQVGAKRFTRIHGLGKDAAGNLYVLNNPWGGTWDLARDTGTDIHAYDASGNLRWTLQSLSFEGVAAPDPVTDGKYFFSGTKVFTGTAGGTFVANTVDPFAHPADPRIDASTTSSRGNDFAQLAAVGGRRILVAAGQNPDLFHFYYFSPATGYVAHPLGSLPGDLFGTAERVRQGFCLDARGDVWAALQTNEIRHYPLTGFDASGKPVWGAGTSTPIPASIGTLARLIYLPETDTMILASRIAGSKDWTSIGTRVEVYRGWLAGNIAAPSRVITLGGENPKSIAAAGDYLFAGYVHTVPDIDAFSLTTGRKVVTFSSNAAGIDVGNDVDSMYGLRAYRRANGEYMVTKSNYNGANVVVYLWTPST